MADFMNDMIYSIKIRNKNIEIEVHGDKEFVSKKFEEIFERINKEGLLISSTKENKVEIESYPLPETSLAELVNEKDPKTNLDIEVVIAYYLLKSEKKHIFDLEDIENRFNQIHRPKPRNLWRDIKKNIKRGYFMPTDENKDGKDAWKITVTGIKYVDQEL